MNKKSLWFLCCMSLLLIIPLSLGCGSPKLRTRVYCAALSQLAHSQNLVDRDGRPLATSPVSGDQIGAVCDDYLRPFGIQSIREVICNAKDGTCSCTDQRSCDILRNPNVCAQFANQKPETADNLVIGTGAKCDVETVAKLAQGFFGAVR